MEGDSPEEARSASADGRRSSRAFTSLDGMILGAFLILAIYGAVVDDRRFLDLLSFHASKKSPWAGLPGWAKGLELPAKRVQSDFAAFLALISLGIGIVTFRRRPLRRRRRPMPGVAATAAVVGVLLATVLLTLGKVAYRRLWSQLNFAGWVELLHGPEFQADTAGTAVVGAVLGTWCYLILARRWRARDDWRDWLGRWLGWAWLCNIPIYVLLIIIWG